MPSKRRSKKGTLSYALEICDREQLIDVISAIGDLDSKAGMEVMNLIKRAKDVYKDIMSPLQGAVSLGYYAICKHLIEEGALTRTAPSTLIPPPLCLAVQKGHFKIARLLIEAGADVTLEFKDTLPICYALENTSCTVQIIKDIIEAGFPPNGTVHYPSGKTSLHVAVSNCRTSIVKYLLSLSIDPNVKDRRGISPLHYAVQKEYYSIVKLLLKNGANVDIECADHFTPMFYAIAKGNYEMVKLLLSLGADVHHVNGNKKCSMMPLHFAANFCRFKITQLLLEKGAEVNRVVPLTEETALHAACRADHQNIQENKVALDCIVELLIKEGADLEVRHKYGFTPLQCAIKSKHFSISKILIINGANLNSYSDSNGSGYTAFHLAAKSFDRDLIKLCLDYGGDYMAQDEEGMYPCGLALLSTVLEFIAHSAHCSQSHSDQLSVFKLFWKHGFPFDMTLKIKWLDYSAPIFPSKVTSFMQKQRMLFNGVRNLQLKTVQKAIAQGAEVKCCSQELFEPIHYIAYKGNYHILKEFLSRGAVVNFLNRMGETPLHTAAREGHLNCCQLLLEHGAVYNYSNKSKDVRSPLQIAKLLEHTEIVKMFVKVDSYFKALSKGELKKLRPRMKLFHALMNCYHRDGTTLLGRAICLDAKEAADQLMKLRLQTN